MRFDARQICGSLAIRWPSTECLRVHEAPENSARQGRKIDVLVIQLWQSRGLDVDAVEIKVSIGDWRRELNNGGKGDFWWRHSDRFWVAAPPAVAEQIKPELPTGWGLLACEPEKKPKVVVQAATKKRDELSWSTMIGLLRSAADAGSNAIWEAERRGEEKGRASAKAEIERSDGWKSYDELQERVKAFEGAAGFQITGYTPPAEIGRAVAILTGHFNSPGRLAEFLDGDIARAEQHIAQLRKATKEIQKMFQHGGPE